MVRAPGRAERLAQPIHILPQPRFCDIPGGRCAFPNLPFACKDDRQPAALTSGDDRVLEKRALGSVDQRMRPKNCSQIVWDNSGTGKDSANVDPDSTRTQFFHDVFDRNAGGLLRRFCPTFHKFRCSRQRHLRRLVIHKTRNRAIRWQQFDASPKEHLNFTRIAGHRHQHCPASMKFESQRRARGHSRSLSV